MKNVIIGNSKFSQLLAEYIEEDGVCVDAFSVEATYIRTPELMGKPVIPLEELKTSFSPEQTQLYLGIGYSKLGEVKKAVYQKYSELGYRFVNYMHKTAFINPDVSLGDGNIFFENVTIQRHSKVGNGNLFFSNSVVMHDVNIGNFNTLGACAVINGYAIVENCSFIGSNATVRNKIKVSTNSLIGAGAYLSYDSANDSVTKPPKSERFWGGVLLSEKI